MDVKSLLEKLLFDDVVEEVSEEPVVEAKPIESIKPIETVKPVEQVVEPVKVLEKIEPVPAPLPKKALIDVNEVTYRPNYKTAASMEKAQYVRQEPISPIFGVVNDKEKGVEKKLTTPQFPSNIEGSRKVEAVLSPIFGKDIPEEENVTATAEKVVIIETPKVELEEKESKEVFKKAEEPKNTYVPRHAEIKLEENDVFYTNGLELDKIISLLNDPEESSLKNEDTSFVDSILDKSESDSDTISIFDEIQ